MDKRTQLEQWTQVVADTGELAAIEALRPQDATTNPSLMLAAARHERGARLLGEACRLAAEIGAADDIDLRCDAFAALIGRHILDCVPGLVSTEVDARLSFDTVATVERARQLIGLYRELGVERDRVLIKIAATWEGIRAAEVLEEEGIHCNLTLIFCIEQAIAAAEAGVTLVSPFVGRIFDWHVRNGTAIAGPDDDPGVQSVREIYTLYRARGFSTIVMGASFRTTGQVEALAGCDKLTISPPLLETLANDHGPLTRRLDPAEIAPEPAPAPLDEAAFRWALNDNPMACELLSDGIRRFARDQETLARQLAEAGD